MLRQLEYFVQLAREQHFARAAEACGISQPALSEAIRKLEAELGVPLVRRGHSFQGLTAEGQKALLWARRILADHQALLQEVNAVQAGLVGTLRLGTVPAVSSTLVHLTDPFTRAHPGVSLQLETSLRSTQILARVRDFELDAGIIYASDNAPEGVLVHPLYAEEHVLIAGEELLPAGDIDWSRALELPLCLLNSSMRGRQVLDEALAAQGLMATARIESDSVLSLLSHVATGHWASIVPRQWLDGLGPLSGITVRTLGHSPITPVICLIVPDSTPMPMMSRALLELSQWIFPDKSI